MSSHLNKLPKDILIRLIESISNKLLLENEHLKLIISDMCDQFGLVKRNCSHKNEECEHFQWGGRHHSNMSRGYLCECCSKYWCFEHIDESGLVVVVHKSDDIKFTSGPICSDCYPKYISQDYYVDRNDYKTMNLKQYINKIKKIE